ncbi:YeeE/YedE family protein [Paracidovorax citrulli]
MTIDWNGFTPYASLAGGVLIGLAASLLILLTGRIAGISGVLGGLLKLSRNDTGWRLAFIAGLFLAPAVYALFAALPRPQVEAGWPAVLLAGLLVGIGSRYGSGCTSGHGVCGIARLSPRSLVATATFMATGFLTVFALRHALGA